MLHSSGDCQSLVSALRSLQIPRVTLTKFCIDAFKWNIWNEYMYFLIGVTNFRVFKASLFIPYSEGLPSWNLWPWHAPKSWELFRTAAGAQLTAGSQSCTCHPSPPFSSLQPNLHYSMWMRVSKDGDFLENRYFFTGSHSLSPPDKIILLQIKFIHG